MPQSILHPAPFRVPLLDDNGQLVETWRRFFLSTQDLINKILITNIPGMGTPHPALMAEDAGGDGDAWIIPGPPGPQGLPGLPAASDMMLDVADGLSFEPMLDGPASAMNDLGVLNSAVNVTCTLPAVTTSIRSGINFDVTSAGSSANSQQGCVFTLEAGYTGASLTVAMLSQTGVASPGVSYALKGRAVGASALNIGACGFCNNGTNNIGVFGGLGNVDGSGFGSVSGCFVGSNGTTGADLISLWSNVTKNFSVTDTGVLTTASSIVSNGGNIQIQTSRYLLWNSQVAILGKGASQLNLFSSSGADPGVGLDFATASVLKIRTTAQTGDASIQFAALTQSGKTTTYNNVATAGLGIPAVYGIDNRTGLTGADGAATTLYTTVAANNIFRISADIFATAAVTGTATYTITWTENTTTQTMVVTATAINTLGTQSNLIRPDNATAITSQLTGVFTGTFTVVGLVEQVA